MSSSNSLPGLNSWEKDQGFFCKHCAPSWHVFLNKNSSKPCDILRFSRFCLSTHWMNLDELSQKLPRPLGKKSKCEGLQCKVQGLMTWWETITNHPKRIIKLRLRFVTVNLRYVSRGRMSLDEPQSRRYETSHGSPRLDKNASHPIRGIHIKFDMCFGSDKTARFFRYRFSLGMLLGWTYFSTL